VTLDIWSFDTAEAVVLTAMGFSMVVLSFLCYRRSSDLTPVAAALFVAAGLAAIYWKGASLVGFDEDQYPLIEAGETLMFALVGAASLAWAVEKVAQHGVDVERANANLRRAHADLRESHSQLVHAEKLAAVGSLTDGVAHEINNPLTYIISNEELSIEELDRIAAGAHLDAREQSALNEIRDGLRQNLAGLQHIASIVGSLRGMARAAPAAKDAVDPRVAVLQAVKLAGDRARKGGVRVHVDLPAALPAVLAAPEEIAQIVLNLLLNAIDASPAGGAVAVTGRTFDGAVEFSVRDMGPGIPEPKRAQVFNPFFTTKRQGLGLGLAISQRIAQSYGGYIRFETETGKGSTFSLRLPCASESPALPTLPPMAARTVGGSA
jgi:signal transduction histidine kinase